MPPRPLVVVTCCLAILGKSGLAHAIEWVAEPSIRTGLEYNDNIFLTTAQHSAVNGANLGANLDLAARQEQWELRGSARLLSKRYGGREDLNTDDATGDLNYNLKTERNVWQLKTSYANESTLSYDKINPDIGVTQKQTKRTTTSASPSWTWLITETTQLRLNYQFARVKYKDGVVSNLLDYDQQTTNLSLSDQIFPRTNISVALNYSDYQVTTPKNAIHTPYTAGSITSSGQLGISYDFTETLKGSLSGGPRKTVSDNVTPLVPVTQSDSGHGSVFAGSLESKLELTSTTLSLSRTVVASGSGSEVQADNLNLGIQRQITPERFSAQLIAEAYVIKALGLTTNAINRNYYRLEPGLRWRWTEDIAVDASYRFARQRYINASDVATSNSVYLTFTYIWPRISVSR